MSTAPSELAVASGHLRPPSRLDAPSRPSLVVEELLDRGAIVALQEEWDRLRRAVADRGSARGPFLSSTWFAIYSSFLVPERRGELRLLVAHRGGRLAAVLPLLKERRLLLGLPARVLRSLSDEHSPRFDVLVENEEAARAVFQHLAGDPSWDVLELRDAPLGPPCSGAGAIMAAARRAGFRTALWPSLRSPYLPLDEEGGGTAKFRANLRRRARKLEQELGPLRLERVTGRAGLDQALAAAFELESSGWKGEARTAIACNPRLAARYRALARAFATEERLVLYFLSAGGRRLASHFALEEDGVYYLLKPGYDAALGRFGPGHLLIDAVAADLRARGMRELDFLGDDLEWKHEWTGRARQHAWHYVFQSSRAGRVLHGWKFQLAPAIKRLLGGWRSGR